MTTPVGANDAFTSGVAHPVNEGRSNLGSITLGGGLQAQSDRWNAESQQAATSPHSVLAPYAFSRSPNGTDGQGFLPNGMYLGNANGMSDGDFEKSLMLRMAGSDFEKSLMLRMAGSDFEKSLMLRMAGSDFEKSLMLRMAGSGSNDNL